MRTARIGRVDVLPARAGRAVGVDLEVLVVDDDVDVVVDHRIDPDAGEARVPPRRAVVRADADEAVDAALGLRPAVRPGPLEQQRRRLDPRLLAGVIVHQLDLEAALLAPAAVHPLEHAGPVLALGPARARVDLDIAVVVVGLAAEQRGDLVGLGLGGERLQRGDAVVGHRLVALGLGHVDQFGRVGEFALDAAGRRHRLIEAAAFLHHRLRRLGVVPQRRVLDPRVQLVEAAEGAIPVKETSSAGRAPAESGWHRLRLRRAWVFRPELDFGRAASSGARAPVRSTAKCALAPGRTEIHEAPLRSTSDNAHRRATPSRQCAHLGRGVRQRTWPMKSARRSSINLSDLGSVRRHVHRRVARGDAGDRVAASSTASPGRGKPNRSRWRTVIAAIASGQPRRDRAVGPRDLAGPGGAAALEVGHEDEARGVADVRFDPRWKTSVR